MTLYVKNTPTEMRPWQEGDNLDKVSISDADRSSGSPKPGDMIAWDPKNTSDQWLVSKEYFEAYYVELPLETQAHAQDRSEEVEKARRFREEEQRKANQQEKEKQQSALAGEGKPASTTQPGTTSKENASNQAGAQKK